MGLRIIGTGRGLPRHEVTNQMLAGLVDTSDEWITTRTGIRSRRVCTDETLTDLSAAAAKNALIKAGTDISDIDLILCSTIGGDYVTPALSCAVSERLGASCPAFDLNAACSGFLYALETADAFLSAGKAQKILIVCAEMMSRHADWTDRKTCVLFGDGAGACVVTNGGALRYIHLTASGNDKILHLVSGTGNSPFVAEKRELGHLHMDGQEVFKFAVGMAEKELSRALDALGLDADGVDHFLIHQANKRIIDAIRTRTGQPEHKFPVNIDRYGNMSSATIPVLLDECLEAGRIQAGDVLYLTAFGAGLTTGTCVMVWE